MDLDRVVGLGALGGPVGLGSRVLSRAEFRDQLGAAVLNGGDDQVWTAAGWMGRPVPGPYARSGAGVVSSAGVGSRADGFGLLDVLGAELLGQLGRCSSTAGSIGSKAIHPKIAVSADEAAYLLEGLVRVGVAQIAKSVGIGGVGPGFGSASPMPILRGIQDGTVRYERYDPDEEWKTWGQLLGELGETGVASGDCEDLSSAVAAELRYAGIPARTYVYQSGPRLYHVVVKTDRWGLLDPSRAAGMEGNG